MANESRKDSSGLYQVEKGGVQPVQSPGIKTPPKGGSGVSPKPTGTSGNSGPKDSGNKD